MKNNKGFTLVEVLAVVAVLLTVAVIITPNIIKHYKNAEQITDQEQINKLIETARIYMNENTDKLPNGNNVYQLTLTELKQSGLIKKEHILNPSTKEELTGCIEIKLQSNKYKYEYKENCN